MKKTNNINILGLLLIFCISLIACDCEDPTNPDCSNYDPCWELEQPNIDFEMGTVYSDPYYELKFPSDTVLYGTIYFNANIENAVSYQWKVGTDTRTWNSKEFTLYFNDTDSATLRLAPIMVTLIVERQPNNLCFPDDDGIDTISKYLHFRSDWESTVWGTWEGYRDSLTNDIYQLKIANIADSPHSNSRSTFIFNQYGEGEDCHHEYTSYSLRGYRALYNKTQGEATNWETCGGPYRRWNRKFAVNVNPKENTIVITWEEWHYGDYNYGDCCVTIPHIFKGHRVQ